VDIVTLQNPFDFLKRDSDIEGLSDGFDERTAYGYVDGIDDPGMGWARYAQTIRIFVLNSGLFYIQPSDRTVRLCASRTVLLRLTVTYTRAGADQPHEPHQRLPEDGEGLGPDSESLLYVSFLSRADAPGAGVQRDDLVSVARRLTQLTSLGAHLLPDRRRCLALLTTPAGSRVGPLDLYEQQDFVQGAPHSATPSLQLGFASPTTAWPPLHRARLSRCARLQFERKNAVGRNRKPVMVHINYHPDKVQWRGRRGTACGVLQRC